MKITVTREDIRAGKRKSCTSCPIALAIRRKVWARLVRVDNFYIKLWPGNREPRLQAALPVKAMQFVRSFDAGVPVQPFTFIVRLV